MNKFRDWNISSHPPWLREDGKNRLFSLQLKNVSNPLDADAIWTHSTSGSSDIATLKGDYTNRRLLHALQAHTYTTMAHKKNVPIVRKFVFSDVVIWIPARFWREADIENGENLLLMSERFRYQHEMAFSEDQRFQQRPPNFCIMPMAELPNDQIICQFGLGVFLPNNNDTQTASISMIKHGEEPQPLPDWIFYEKAPDNDSYHQVTKVRRSSGLYADQTMLLISHNHYQSSIISPYWINGHSDGEVIINLNSSKPSAYGDEHNITAQAPKRVGAETNCYFHEPGNTENGITLAIERLSQRSIKESLRASSNHANTGTVIDSQDSLSGLTNIDIGRDNMPDYMYQLKLVGIVLPRLDRLKAASKLSHWELALDQAGLPVSAEEEPVWFMRSTPDATGLEWRDKNNEDSAWQTLDKQAPLPYPKDQAVHILPPALADKQLGILPLSASATQIPLNYDEVILGRDIGESSLAEVPLSTLNHCSDLIYSDGSRRDSLDLIGLSGEHILTKLEGGLLELQQIKSVSYILTENGAIRQTLNAKDNRGELTPGEKLIIGPLCFEFTEEFLPNRVE